MTILCSMFIAIFMRIINLAEYFTNGIGENCPATEIIDTESECKNSAADFLGWSFGGSYSSTEYPAGCYWTVSRIHFNRVIDPSQTNQESFGNRGGVCVRTGKRKNIMYEYISLH